jgi:signal peptidase I
MNLFGRVQRALSLKIVSIHGSSMEPALPDGSCVIVDRRAFQSPRKPARFDIVRLEDPARRGHWIVKRIVGLPDEEVRLDGGLLFVNGKQVSEAYLGVLSERHTVDAGINEWWARFNEYVVLGDNRNASTDSRKFGTVPIEGLRGRVSRRLH